MIYPDNFEYKTGISRIREIAKSYCLFEPGRQAIDKLQLLFQPDDLKLRLNQVGEFRLIISEGIQFPIDNFIDISTLLSKTRIDGSFIEEQEIFDLRRSLESVRSILTFLKNDEKSRFPSLKILADDVKIFPAVIDKINHIINKNGKIKDNASKDLQNIRGDLTGKQTAISRKLNNILHKAQSEGWVGEDVTIAIRNGRPVIPVPANYKRRISGYIHDESGTGKTAYIEPAEVLEANNELRELEIAERREIVKILTEFTKFLRPYIDDLLKSHEFLAEIDSCRARARFALSINAILPKVKNDPGILWTDAIHPLLLLSFRESGREKEVISQSIHLDQKNRILVISGPNAGGKSVCLQTVGILQYMLQCGFLVTVKEGSEFGIFHDFFIDIGDEQSIEDDLSTYSSHLLNMKVLLKNASDKTLALIDEFGSGTEPIIGGAIAEAVLERINQQGCFGVITTHYTNLKHFAASADGIINGAMLFDIQKIQPLFQLAIGRPGSSFAYEIARKIGLPEDILNKAKDKAGQDNIEFDKHLRDIIRDKTYWENKRQDIRISEKRLSELVEKYDTELGDTVKQRKKIIQEAKAKAEELLSSANKQIENTIREIKEAEAGKEKTRIARQKLETFKETVSKIDDNKEDILINKLEEIKKHERVIETRKVPIKKNKPLPFKTDDNIYVGDHVMMKGQDTPGEVMEIKGKKIIVAFGNIQTRVIPGQLEKISNENYKQISRPNKIKSDLGDWNIGIRRLNFRADIDLRGKRAEEAIRLLTEFIDEAIMVQSRELRVLHGKGNGILRELIRQQLKINNVVEWFGDEHVERGGSGITLVRLDV